MLGGCKKQKAIFIFECSPTTGHILGKLVWLFLRLIIFLPSEFLFRRNFYFPHFQRNEKERVFAPLLNYAFKLLFIRSFFFSSLAIRLPTPFYFSFLGVMRRLQIVKNKGKSNAINVQICFFMLTGTNGSKPIAI